MPINNIVEFLGDRRIQLPLDWSNWNGCYLSYIEDLFKHYKRLISEFVQEDALLHEIHECAGTINELCNGIIDTIQLYIYKGKEDAYEKFKGLLEQQNIKDCLDKLYSSEVESNHNSLKNLYKVRKFPAEDINAVLEKQTLEMFHVPQCINRPLGRYDYGEFPCLYLGGSIPFCIKETIDYTQRSFPSNIVWAKFELTCSIKVLDFGWKPKNLVVFARGYLRNHGQNHNLAKFIVNQVIMWPLIAVCSVCVRAPNDCCKPEYIISNLLIKYIYENNDRIDGIRYFSTKYKKDSERDCECFQICDYCRENINFVFPAKLKDNKEKYSSVLAQKFKISKTQCVNESDLRQWRLLEQDCNDIHDNIHRTLKEFTHVSDLLEH